MILSMVFDFHCFFSSKSELLRMTIRMKRLGTNNSTQEILCNWVAKLERNSETEKRESKNVKGAKKPENAQRWERKTMT